MNPERVTLRQDGNWFFVLLDGAPTNLVIQLTVARDAFEITPVDRLDRDYPGIYGNVEAARYRAVEILGTRP